MSKSAKSQSRNPPARLVPGMKDPLLATGSPVNTEDWKTKNARAKELIMSTLVPGSEPWKIAEPLELASDIWKALEAKYAPAEFQSVKRDMNERALMLSGAASQAGTKPNVAANISAESEIEAKRRRDAQARATKEFNESMPKRNQRFLWALLHGGKDETNAWFYGGNPER